MPVAAQAYESTDTPIAVADGAAGGSVCGDPGAASVSTITVGDAGTISDLNIFVDIASTWIGDVTVVVSNGTNSATIIDRPGATTATACGNGNDNFPGIFIDDQGGNGTIEDALQPVARNSYTPNQPLSVFNGQPIAGTWTFTITDGGEGDDTVLNEWQLLFNGAFPVSNEGTTPESRSTAFELRGINPFDYSTRFDLRVEETQEVRVVAYDALGREAASLFQGTVSAGTTVPVVFERGELQAGIYVVRALGASFDEAVRVTLVR